MQIVTVSDSDRIYYKGSKGPGHTSYYLNFSQNIRGKNSISVSESLYEIAKTNDTLVLIIQEGALGLPYISSDIKVLKTGGHY